MYCLFKQMLMAKLVVSKYGRINLWQNNNKVELVYIKYKFCLLIVCFYLISDKNLTVSISGDVDEAKALSKPLDDSQGTYSTVYAHHYD